MRPELNTYNKIVKDIEEFEVIFKNISYELNFSEGDKQYADELVKSIVKNLTMVKKDLDIFLEIISHYKNLEK